MMLTALEALVDNPGRAVTLVGDGPATVSHQGETTLPRGTLLPHQESKKSTWDIRLPVDSVKSAVNAALYPKSACNIRL